MLYILFLQDEEILSHPLPDCYCPLIVEPPPAPLAPPYRGARKVRPPKFYTHSSHTKNQLNRERHYNAGQAVKLSYASIGFTECEDEEVDVIEEIEEEREKEEEGEEKDDGNDDDDDDVDDMETEDEGGESGEKTKEKKSSNKKKKARDNRLLNDFKKAHDNESDFELEELDCYDESDELLEAFQMTQMEQKNGDSHKTIHRWKPEKQAHYQNQQLISSWKYRQGERKPQRWHVLEATEELDEASDCEEKDEIYEESEKDRLVYADKDDNADRQENADQRYPPENMAILSSFSLQDELELHLSTADFVSVDQSEQSASNRQEVLSVNQMKHSASLPSVHYQNCDGGNIAVKQKLRGVFSLT